MKFCNLTFDANLPTTQQVNIPTNTDYKVGLKFKKGGVVQDITTSSVTVLDGALSATIDESKTNGYITFTSAAGDEASFKQLNVNVDVADTPATSETVVSSLVNTSGAAMSNQGIDMEIADYESLIGKEVTPESIYIANVAGSGTTAPTVAEIEADLGNLWEKDNASVKITLGSSTSYLMVPATATRDAFKENFNIDTDKPFFVKYVNNAYDSWLEKYTLTSEDVIVPPKNRLTNNTSRGWGIRVQLDDLVPGWSSSFKLNVNTFKSQQGDINVAAAASSTATFAGTFSDNTEFSYDVVVNG